MQITARDASTISEQCAVARVSDYEVNSLFCPGNMGNVDDIAYGRCTIVVGINAACQTVKRGYHVYSIMGNYLGPAFTDRKY
jgi:hypothetical protein